MSGYQPKVYKDNGGNRLNIGVGGVLDLQGQVTGLTHGNHYYVDSVNGDSGNDGLSWATAIVSLDAAVALCTANNGDVIHLAPGHNEGIGDAQIDLDVAGITVIGHGSGSARPRFDFDHANASIDIGADGVTLENIQLLPSVTAVLIAIDVEANVNDVTLRNITTLSGEDGAGVDEFAETIELNAGCHRTLIEGCTFTQHASAAGVLSCILLQGASDGVIIRDCSFWAAGAGLVAPINGDTTLSTNLLIERCTIMTDAEPGIELLTGTTGIIRDVDIFADLATIDAATVADGMAHFRVQYCEVGDEAGTLVKTESADD